LLKPNIVEINNALLRLPDAVSWKVPIEIADCFARTSTVILEYAGVRSMVASYDAPGNEQLSCGGDELLNR